MPPLADRPRGRNDEFLAESTVDMLAALDVPTPAGITVDAQRHPALVGWGDPAREPIHGVGGPLQSRLDRPQIAAQEGDGCMDEVVAHRSRQSPTGAVDASAAWLGIRIVEQPHQELHQAAIVSNVGPHLLQFQVSSRDDPGDPRLVLDPRVWRPQVTAALVRNRAIELEQLERLGDPPALEIDGLLEAAQRHRFDPFEGFEDLVHVDRRRKRRVQEEFGDLVVLAAGEQDSVRVVDRPTGATHLLVVRDGRPGPLIVDDEAEIGLVEPHPQGDRRHERLDLVGDQGILEHHAFVGREVGVVGLGIDPL